MPAAGGAESPPSGGEASTPLAPGPGRLSIEFRPLKKKVEARGKAVWNDGFLRRGVGILNSRLTLPFNVTIAIRPGESVDASPEPGKPLVLGYINPIELRPVFSVWGLFTRSGKKIHPPHTPAGRKMIDHGVTELEHALAFHEVGHVYTEQWPIPTTSDNEQIADLFSAWVTVKLMHDPEALLALANYRLALAYFFTRDGNPGQAAWERGQGYADLARLAAAEAGWAPAVRKLLPKEYLHEANYASFVGGAFHGLEDALEPIAIAPLG